ncbi:hypothetical protein [Pseudoalteromonas sp. BDTF-M6]|uniref:hypothetical protein n=1 Tax=Pseudoalteromonas sp. BDTF-M6 TaxID=2796132 RepID=UPI001BB07961|nr:hypothetical protein [Pseudoalteromonas sp. BDTF-M6]MBS3796363.1 hypothetical protein [Pseudoalteromonas sp. BDTF-M6]
MSIRLLFSLFISSLLLPSWAMGYATIEQQLQSFSFPDNCTQAPVVPDYDDRNVDWNALEKKETEWRTCLINAKGKDAHALKTFFIEIGGDLTQSPINRKLYPKYPRNCQCGQLMDQLLGQLSVREQQRYTRFQQYIADHEERNRRVDEYNRNVAKANQRNFERQLRKEQKREREATYDAIWRGMQNARYQN